MSRAPAAVLVALLMPGCLGGESSPPGCDYVLEPLDCADAAARPFRVDFGADGLDLFVADSHRKYVMPAVRSDCESTIISVTWTVEDPSVVEVTDPATSDAAYGIASAWITGLRPGETMVGARIVFKHGTVKEARPGTVRVERDRPPRGTAILASGSIPLANHLIPFALARPGTVEVVLDWTSRPHNPLFWVHEGECAATPCAGRVAAQYLVNSGADRKPLRATAELPAGPHTLRVAPSQGSGPDTLDFEIRLAP